MEQLKGMKVRMTEGEFVRREHRNRDYLMKLTNHQLLRNYKLEAGRHTTRGDEKDIMGGWEDATCQIRGHFLGHWLSAAALRYEEVQDEELKAKTAAILKELAECQKDNGGEWAGPIPEKYLYWIAEGRMIWAPQYNLHKLFMGLIDVYQYMGLELALEIAEKLAAWFDRWSGSYTREKFDDILDSETGGMMEIWAQLYHITGKEMYKTLMERYYRRRLFEPLLEGKDVLTNMHANTTIPEVLGCARAYEVTGEEKWLKIAEMYWKCAVTDRGWFATGGQTQGEIWTPMMKLKRRLGDKNQEHCTVYNMIRLAEFLFRQTKDPKYMHYIEYNIKNGVMAQTYCGNGLLTYFLPMKAGSRKGWAGEMDSFFCCHGTMVQANAAWNRLMYYKDKDELLVTRYENSEAEFEMGGETVRLTQWQDHMNGSLQTSSENNAAQEVNEIASVFANTPEFKKYVFTLHLAKETEFTLSLRIPDWISREAKVFVNDELFTETKDTAQFVKITRTWKDQDVVVVTFPIGLKFIPLPDDETMGAFRFGPDVLAGITEQERVLHLETERPEDELSADTEREWGSFRTFFRTENQDPGISFKKLNEVVHEPYQIYFKVKNNK